MYNNGTIEDEPVESICHLIQEDPDLKQMEFI